MTKLYLNQLFKSHNFVSITSTITFCKLYTSSQSDQAPEQEVFFEPRE